MPGGIERSRAEPSAIGKYLANAPEAAAARRGSVERRHCHGHMGTERGRTPWKMGARCPTVVNDDKHKA